MKHTRICAVFILMALVLLTGCSKHGDKAEYFFADELSGKKIGIVTGMTSEKQVDSLIKNAKIKEFKTPEDGARALKDKQILALAVDALHTDEVLKDPALAPLLQNLVDLKYCAVFYMSGKTSEEDLTMQFDAALNKMIADGRHAKLVEKYFGDKEPETGDIKYNEGKVAGRVLSFGVASDNKPYSYKDASGKLVGFDVEIANAVAKDYGAKLEVREYPREKLLDAIKAKEVMFAMGSLTAEKQKDTQFFYTQSYFDASQRLVLNDVNAGKNPLKK